MIRWLRLLTWLLALTLGVEALAAGLVARLDRSRVVEGDAVVLTLAASGDSSGLPDLTPLQKDFDLLNQSQSTHMQIINGRSSSGREWQLTLMPKRSGKIEIPAIAFGAGASKPLTLDVVPAAQAAKQGMPRPVLVEVDAEPRQPYVQQKVNYTVRALFAVPLSAAPSLSEPQVTNAIVRRLGEDKRYETQRNGQQFQVLERRYAILPQYSGELRIAAPVLNARVQEPGQRGNSLRDRFFGRDPFGGLGGPTTQTRPIQLRGEELTLAVQPQPAGTPTPWLPAESLTLNETWSQSPPVFRVGEPVTRTIAITAQGLAGEQLPELDLAGIRGMKVYPDKSHAETRPDQDTLVSQKVLSAALVPSQAGDLTLPEIRVAWWDTASRQLQVARLPGRTVQVLPGESGAMSAGQAGVVMPRPVAPPLVDREAPRPATPPAAAAGSGDRDDWPTSIWPWVALLFGLGWAASTGLWLRERRATPAQPVPAVPAAVMPPAPRPARSSLVLVERACRKNDPRAVRQTLLDWAQAHWPDAPPRGLEGIGERLGGEAAAVLQDIDRRLYAGETGGWDGVAAWRRLGPALAQGGSGAAHGASHAPLPPLYPTQV